MVKDNFWIMKGYLMKKYKKNSVQKTNLYKNFAQNLDLQGILKKKTLNQKKPLIEDILISKIKFPSYHILLLGFKMEEENK